MNRVAWQAARAAENFPDGAGPFLAPEAVDEDALWQLFGSSHERDFDTFMTARTQSEQGLRDETEALLSEVQELVRSGLQMAIEQGYAPSTALDRVEPAFTQTAIRVDSGQLQDNEIALYEHSTDILTLSPQTTDYDLRVALAHELGGHKVSGGTFVRQWNGDVERVRRGFVTYSDALGGLLDAHRGLDEAVQQHLALSYIYGQIDKIDPDERTDGNLQYYDLRKMLAEFIARSGGIIDLKTITRASFEDTEVGNATTVDRRNMIRQVRTAYGAGAYRKLHLLLTAIDLDDRSAEELTHCIQGPTHNTTGKILWPSPRQGK